MTEPKRTDSHPVISTHVFVLMLTLFIILLVVVSAPTVQAAPVAQIPVYTPTPGTDGRIVYIVKQGDTLISISIISGVSIEKLKELNNLTSDEIIEGQTLVLGLAGPAAETVTPGPSPTPTPLLPTPSPNPGSGIMCILLFNDINGDSIREEDTELSIPGGAISISNASGEVNLTYTTLVGTDPYCFPDIPEGEYTISVAVPTGYNPTTESSYILTLNAGDETYLDFGAQVRDDRASEELPDLAASGTKKSPLLGIIGVVFLLGGLGLAIAARQLLKGK